MTTKLADPETHDIDEANSKTDDIYKAKIYDDKDAPFNLGQIQFLVDECRYKNITDISVDQISKSTYEIDYPIGSGPKIVIPNPFDTIWKS